MKYSIILVCLLSPIFTTTPTFPETPPPTITKEVKEPEIIEVVSYEPTLEELIDALIFIESSGRENATSYQKEWDKDYSMDLIGREYCRDRQLMTSKENYDQLIFWKTQKSAFVMAHENWIKSIMAQMKEVRLGLKGYKYLDEALELSTELGLDIKDVDIVQTNSTGLTIFNPKNLADRIKGMKNIKKQTTQEKILARMEYERQVESMN